MAESGAVPVGHTHLYPGLRLRLTPEAGAAAWTLLFADGEEAAAELLTGHDGSLALAVEAHTTAAGTPVPARVWPLRPSPSGGVRLGRHL